MGQGGRNKPCKQTIEDKLQVRGWIFPAITMQIMMYSVLQ